MNITDAKGNKVDETKLTDAQAMLLDKVKEVNFDDLLKHGGSYLLWANFPESKKAALSYKLANENSWLSLFHSLNVLIQKSSNGKLKLILEVNEDGEESEKREE